MNPCWIDQRFAAFEIDLTRPILMVASCAEADHEPAATAIAARSVRGRMDMVGPSFESELSLSFVGWTKAPGTIVEHATCSQWRRAHASTNIRGTRGHGAHEPSVFVLSFSAYRAFAHPAINADVLVSQSNAHRRRDRVQLCRGAHRVCARFRGHRGCRRRS